MQYLHRIQNLPLHHLDRFERCAQSLRSSHSAVKLVGPFLDHHHYESSLTSVQLQTPLQLPAPLYHYNLVYQHAGHAFFFGIFAR